MYSAQHYISKKSYTFPNVKELHAWAIARLVVLGIIFALCLVVLIVPLVTGEPAFSMLFMLPYMARIAFFKLKGLFDTSDWVKEFLGFFIVLIATVTVIYPLYKFIRETIYYVSYLKVKE